MLPFARWRVLFVLCTFGFALPASPEPLKAVHPTGAVPIDPVIYAAFPLARKIPAGALPSASDFTRLMPPPGNQGPRQGSCTAWAVAYATMSFNAHLQRGWPNYGLKYLFSPAYLFNPLANGNCGRGITVLAALGRVQQAGAATLQQFAYDPADCLRQPSPKDIFAAQPYAIASFGKVPKDLNEIKWQLRSNTPVIVSLYLDGSFNDLANTPGVYHWQGGLNGGYHSMVIVGYDDTLDGGNGAFRLENSWGPDWGDKGFIWLGYADAVQAIDTLFVIQDDSASSSAEPGAAPAAARRAVLEFDATEEVSRGEVSTALTTASNDSLIGNWQNGPAKQYTMAIQPDLGVVLREPSLTCVAGRCEESLQAHGVSLEDGGRRAVASVTSKGPSTTWVLNAKSFTARQASPVTTTAHVGDVIQLEGNPGSDPFHIVSGSAGGPVFTVEPAEGTRQRLQFLGVEVSGVHAYYKFRVTQ